MTNKKVENKEVIAKVAENKETTEKRTKKELFNELLTMQAIAENKELKDFILHEIELLERKRNSGTKITATQKENMKIMEEILVALEKMESPVTVGQLRERSELSRFSTPKISALLKKLREAEKVEREVVKKTAYYQIAGKVFADKEKVKNESNNQSVSGAVIRAMIEGAEKEGNKNEK